MWSVIQPSLSRLVQTGRPLAAERVLLMETLPVMTDEIVKAPLPAWSYRIANPTLKFLLCSPLHRAVSGGTMMLYFVGRKTGKRYDVVLAYHEEGGKLYTFSSSPWSRNFIGGAAVTLRLRGEMVPATATVVDDLALTGRVIRRMAHGRGEKLVTGMGLIGAAPDGTTRLQMPKSSRLVEFTLTR